MTEKNFGVKKLDIIGSGTPTIESPSGGDLNITAATSTFSGNVTLPDNKKLRLGNTAGDFDIYYDDNVYLKTGSKGFNIQSYNGHFRISTGANDDLKFAFSVAGIVCADDLIPEANGTRDLGLSGMKWKDAYLSGTINANTFSGSGASLTGIANANISNSAAIAGTKISPDFGTQNITTTGKVGIGSDNPTQALDVNGKIRVFGSDGTGYGLVISPDSSGGTYETLIAKSNGDIRIQAGSGTYQATAANILLKNSTDHIIINAGNSGNVAIGTNDPNAPVLSTNTSKLAVGIVTAHQAYIGNVRVSDEHLKFDTTGKGIIFGNHGGSDRPSIIGNYTSATDNNIVFNVEGTERVRITSGDNSATNPQGYLHVKGDGGGASGTEKFFIIESTNSGYFGPNLTMQHSSSSPADNDVISVINFNGLDDAGHITAYASIEVQATDVSDASPKGDLIFGTRDTDYLEKLRITSDGHLLPGTDSQYNIGSNAVRFANIYADTFTGALTGNAATATTASNVTVRTDSGNANHNVVFVDSTTDNQNQVLKMDDENNRLQWNPSSELLLAYRLQSTDYIRSSKIRTNSGSYGTAGQVLTSQGSGSDWTWETSSSGNIEPAIEVTQRTNDFTTTSTSYQTAVTTTIDPVDSGSTLLIVAGGLMAGYRQDDSDDPERSVPIIQLYRGTTALGQEMKGATLPDDNSTGYYRIGFNLTFKDTNNHGGNSVTYYLKIKRDSNSDHKNVAIFRATTLTVQEII